MMATTTPQPVAGKLRCSHDGIHGPDSEPGAVQRCMEETIALRVEESVGKLVYQAIERLSDDLIPALIACAVRETLVLADEEGSLTHPVLEPSDKYGRSKPFVAEWGHS